jgi:large subunit ribosomal protein L33
VFLVFLTLKAIGKIMSQQHLIKLTCSDCKRINYWSRKNKKQVERKIELKKYCKWCRKQVVHKEAKK